MNENLTSLIKLTSVEFSYLDIFVNLLVCLLSSYALVWTYNKFSRTNTNKSYFSKDFPMYGIAIFTIIMVIQSSIALSLGLVGALSIIRFRTAIKEPEQLIYMLMITAISIGTAAGQYRLVLVATAIFILINVLRNGRESSKNDGINTFVIVFNGMYEGEVINALNKHGINVNNLKHRREANEEITATYVGIIDDPLGVNKSLNDLKEDAVIETNYYKD